MEVNIKSNELSGLVSKVTRCNRDECESIGIRLRTDSHTCISFVSGDPNDNCITFWIDDGDSESAATLASLFAAMSASMWSIVLSMIVTEKVSNAKSQTQTQDSGNGEQEQFSFGARDLPEEHGNPVG